MKDSGKKFEELLKTSAREQGWDYNRMNDAGFMLRTHKQENRAFTPKNICDCTLFGKGCLFYVECKVSSTSRFDFSRATQQKALMKKHNERNVKVRAGYLLSLAGDFFYVPAYVIQSLIDKAEKKSVNISDLRLLGCEISKVKTNRQKIARVNLTELPTKEAYD